MAFDGLDRMGGVCGRALAGGLLLIGSGTATAAIPSCRLDGSGAKLVDVALHAAATGLSELQLEAPFARIVINPTTAVAEPRTLKVFIVQDASVSMVDASGCIKGSPPLVKGEELDPISVKGGCVAVAAGSLEIRCSSQVVQLFGRVGNRDDRANPALLYVLTHEFGHILQRRAGEYGGRVEPIDLNATQVSKLDMLKDSCEPAISRAEEDADKLATRVLTKRLPKAPYREPLFSEQGSVLWGIDQLYLAANTWRQEVLEREFISQPKPHPAFVARQLPATRVVIDANAKRFVCDVLTKRKGVVLYPGRATTHPPLEIRLQRVAEALRPVAASLPRSSAQQEYRPVAALQEQLSDIFTFLYRENGIYLQALQSAICTRVNADHPTKGC